MVSQERKRTVGATLLAGAGLALYLATEITAQRVATYVAAARGWLYVVASDYDTHTGRILVVDPESGRVVGGFTRGYQPDLLPALDANRLFISYDRMVGETAAGAFEAVDASSGTVLMHVDEAESRGGMHGVYRSQMALSRDGAWLFRYKTWISDVNGTSNWLETFDIARNALLPGKAFLPLCGDATIVPSTERRTLFVVCSRSEDIRVVTLSDSGGVPTGAMPRVSVGPGQIPGFPPRAFLQDGARTLTVINSDGSFLHVDTASRNVIHRDVVDRAARQVPAPADRPVAGRRPNAQNPRDWLAGRAVGAPGGVLSPDGSRIYLGVMGKTDSEIAVLTSDTLERLGTIPFTRPFVSFTISSDGAKVYAVDRKGGAVAVIDAASGKELRIIPGLGPGPVFAVVAR